MLMHQIGSANDENNLKIYNKAKQMEKGQIIDACHHGVDYDKSPYLNAKEYYNGTYGK